MSTYNPLHAFRNYVPHFAIVALKDTSAASQFFQTNANSKAGMNLYLHPPGGRKTQYDAQGPNKDYVVVFNSTTDAEFYIDKLVVTTIMQPQAAQVTAGYNVHCTGTEMHMKIIEPYTVDYVTTILAVQQNLGLSVATNIQYILKIFFVGYLDNASGNEVDVVANIAPLIYRVQQIDLTLTHAGAEYAIKCILDTNAGNNVKFNEVGGITMQTADNVAGSIDKLNAKLAERTDLNTLNIKISNPSFKYKIFIDPVYSDPKYKISNITADHQNNFPAVNGNSNVQFVTGRGDTITDVITNIMLLSEAVVNESKVSTPPAPGEVVKTYVHKIHTCTTTKDDIITHNYYVLRQEVAVVGAPLATDPQSKAAVDQPTAPLILNTTIASSYLVYDYIYTGKNADILQYVMTIPMVGDGTPFMLYQTNTAGSSMDQTKLASDQQNPKIANTAPKGGHNETGTIVTSYGAAPQTDKVATSTPLPVPTVDKKAAGTGAKNAALFYQGRQILSKFISNNNIQAALEIVGNPLILNTVIQPVSTYANAQGEGRTAAEVKQQIKARKGMGGLAGAAFSQNLVKINVRVPKPTYAQGDVYGGTVDAFGKALDPEYENKFSTAFWNNNCYTITTIDHVFEKNKFTQSMKLLLRINDSSGTVDQHAASPTGGESSSSGNNKGKGLPGKQSTKDNNDRRQYVFNGLIQRGFSTVHAAGLVGNFAIEDPTFLPDKNEIGGGGGYGLAQWTNTKSGKRKDAMINWVTSNGGDPANIDSQLDYVAYELSPRGPESHAYNKLMQTDNPAAAAVAVQQFYERPYVPTMNLAGRISAANNMYDIAMA